MAEKFPYLARQINGPIAISFGKGIDSVYENDAEFIDFLSRFSIDSLEGKWLDALGMLLGLPRPWIEIPMTQEALLFDNIPNSVPNPLSHAFSTDRNVIIGGLVITPNMGGKFDNTNKSVSVEPISDIIYRTYLKCACAVKKRHSINGIADVVELFCGSKQYAITFISDEDWMNDILVELPIRLLDYQATLQYAFDKMFTTAPKVLVRINPSFDDKYITPDVSRIVYNIVGNDDFSITNLSKLDKLFINVSLGQINKSYINEVKEALNKEYATYNDIVISVTILSIEVYLLFDNIPSIVPNPESNSFSTDRNVIIGAQVITPNMGGKFDERSIE